jgi:GNAT superfamily N-acetyltransferase
MQPAWFPLDNLPFDQMWADNGYWLPAVLSGLQVEASFSFQVDQQTVDHYTLEYQRDSFIISTDRDRLDVDAIHTFLSTNSYWAQDRSRSVVEISIANSFCFGLYQGWKQIGFARVVTDYATFAWLCDVFIQKAYRGYGLGKWLVQSILHHPVVYSLRRVLLATRDAHGLYNKYGGFEPLRAPDRWMERLR